MLSSKEDLSTSMSEFLGGTDIFGKMVINLHTTYMMEKQMLFLPFVIKDIIITRKKATHFINAMYASSSFV